MGFRTGKGYNGLMPVGETLSIVIPTHNTRDLVCRCLASIRKHTGNNVEVIVVDDASIDGSAANISRDFPEAHIIENNERMGFSGASNRGLALARGEYLLLLNSDTMLLEGGTDTLIRHFEENPSTGILGAQLLYPDLRPQWSAGDFPTLTWLFALSSGLGSLKSELLRTGVRMSLQKEETRKVDWVCGAAIAIRKKVWEEVGKLNETYSVYGQDLDYCRRAMDKGWERILLGAFRVIHEHGATISNHQAAAGRVQPAALWMDLLRYLDLHEGPRAGESARRVMLAGARLRILGRKLGILFTEGDTRSVFREETAAFRRAAAELSRNAASS